MNIDIILASKSPRRRELLSQIDVTFRCMNSEKEEIVSSTVPSEVVCSLACQKAEDIEQQISAGNCPESPILIIGADTVVSYAGKILGKPRDEREAVSMIELLSGKCHEVYTGVAAIYINGNQRNTLSFYECTKVYVRELSKNDILEYTSTGESLDKAGAYGIQGRFAKYVTRIDGDYNNVVGMPLARLFYEIRKQFGIDITDNHSTD